jgi:hypothetical protein
MKLTIRSCSLAASIILRSQECLPIPFLAPDDNEQRAIELSMVNVPRVQANQYAMLLS